MRNHNDAMSTRTIASHYNQMYGEGSLPIQSVMTQILLNSRMFTRVGWVNKDDETRYYAHTGSVDSLRVQGVPNTNLVCVIEARTIEQIAKPYLDPTCSPLRRLDRMPRVVREYVKTQRGEEQ